MTTQPTRRLGLPIPSGFSDLIGAAQRANAAVRNMLVINSQCLSKIATLRDFFQRACLSALIEGLFTKAYFIWCGESNLD